MKKSVLIYVLLPLALFSGCTSLSEHTALTLSFGVDFREYLKEGFIVTPYRYEAPHDILGTYRITVFPEVKKTTDFSNINPEKYELLEWQDGRYLISHLDRNEALKEAVKFAKYHDADILMDFKIELTKVDYVVWGYEISGVLGKKK